MGQGPESLDRLGTLSLSKRPVEGLRPSHQGAHQMRPYVTYRASDLAAYGAVDSPASGDRHSMPT